MEALKGMDDVAYVRFASVYKNFREPARLRPRHRDAARGAH
jgi:transcriptional regulator NrdR family protein